MVCLSVHENMRTTAEIADEYVVSPNAVIRCLRANGVKVKGRGEVNACISSNG